jgi:hypothetical protein
VADETGRAQGTRASCVSFDLSRKEKGKESRHTAWSEALLAEPGRLNQDTCVGLRIGNCVAVQSSGHQKGWHLCHWKKYFSVIVSLISCQTIAWFRVGLALKKVV